MTFRLRVTRPELREADPIELENWKKNFRPGPTFSQLNIQMLREKFGLWMNTDWAFIPDEERRWIPLPEQP
ncbi:hypothetical protein QUB61_01370 [Microcoleus sp. C2D2]